MLDPSSSPSATTQKYSTTPSFSLRYPLIPEWRGVRLPGAGLVAGVSYTVTKSSLYY